MNKNILFLVVLTMIMIVVVACGGNDTTTPAVSDVPEATAPEATPEPEESEPAEEDTGEEDEGQPADEVEEDEAEEIEEEETEEVITAVEPVGDSNTALVGTWDWMGSPYYVLEADGTGTMAGEAIRWISANGILSVCITPDLCGDTCILPADWYYILEGNQLDLTSTVVAGMNFTYNRR
ncbi:MAG: hypothetical protein FWE05_08135 [Defluviitaleaceae bacterium]|nr:hypothetical protein [Defluviitaleaceae bacterium]